MLSPFISTNYYFYYNSTNICYFKLAGCRFTFLVLYLVLLFDFRFILAMFRNVKGHNKT